MCGGFGIGGRTYRCTIHDRSDFITCFVGRYTLTSAVIVDLEALVNRGQLTFRSGQGRNITSRYNTPSDKTSKAVVR